MKYVPPLYPLLVAEIAILKATIYLKKHLGFRF